MSNIIISTKIAIQIRNGHPDLDGSETAFINGAIKTTLDSVVATLEKRRKVKQSNFEIYCNTGKFPD